MFLGLTQESNPEPRDQQANTLSTQSLGITAESCDCSVTERQIVCNNEVTVTEQQSNQIHDQVNKYNETSYYCKERAANNGVTAAFLRTFTARGRIRPGPSAAHSHAGSGVAVVRSKSASGLTAQVPIYVVHCTIYFTVALGVSSIMMNKKYSSFKGSPRSSKLTRTGPIFCYCGTVFLLGRKSP